MGGFARAYDARKQQQGQQPGAIMSGLGAAGQVLDAPRQALWTGAEKLSSELGALLGTRTDPVPTWEEAWREMESGSVIIERLAPEFAARHKTLTTVLGIGLEIAGDPLNLMLGVGLTTKGLKAQKVGKLGMTWGDQVAQGQRAFARIAYPSFKGGFHLERAALVRGERAVEAMAATGRFLGRHRPFSWFRTGSLNPYVRAAKRSADEILLDPANPRKSIVMKVLKLQDEVDGLANRFGPEAWQQINRAAEHIDPLALIGKSGGEHAQRLAQFTPEIVEGAKFYQAHIQTAIDLLEGAGMKAPNSGGAIAQAIRSTKAARGREFDRMIGVLSRNEQKVLKDAVAWGDKATGLWDQGDAMWARLRAVERSGELTEEIAPAMIDEVEQVFKQAERANAKAATRRAKALRITDKMEGFTQGWTPGTKKLQDYDAKLAKLAELQGQQPAYVPRYLSDQMRHAVMAKPGVSKELSKVTWTNDLHGRIERRFVDQFNATSLQKLGPYDNMRNALKTLKRDLDLDEILDLMKQDLPGTRIPEFQRIARGGVIDRLTDMYRKLPNDPKLKNLYQMDFGKNYRRFTDHIMESIRGKEFMDNVLSIPEIASQIPQAGWLHLKELSGQVAEYAAKTKGMGDVWLHPDAFQEFRRIYGEIVNPESASRFIRGYDKFTKAFKWMVTAPWPAYHWRNNFSDFVLMSYNGEFSPGGVVKNGFKAMRGKADELIDMGSHLGKVPADEARRLAVAHGVMFGEQASIASLKGRWNKAVQFPENVRRAGYFIDRVQRGYTPYDAALAVKKVLFDYSELGTDAQTLRRVIPFWSWLQHNTARQMESLISNPAILSHQMRVGGSVEKVEGVPSWMRGRMMIALDKDQQTGEERLLTGIGLPVEDVAEMLDFNGGVNEWMRQLMFKVNPALKLGIGAGSYLAGQPYDIERGRPMDRPVSAPYLRGIYESGNKDRIAFIERVFDARKRKTKKGVSFYTISPGMDFVLRNLPTTRVYSTLKQWGREGAPLIKTIAPEFVQRNLPLAERLDKAARTLTGYAVIPYDRRTEERRDERRDFESRMRALRRKGDVGFMTIPYRTRGSKVPQSEFQQLLNAGRR